MLTITQDPLLDLVLQLRSHQYLDQIHPQRLPQADYPHPDPVCLCLDMVRCLCAASEALSAGSAYHTCSQEWASQTDARSTLNYTPTGALPIVWAHPFFHRNVQDSRLPCTHHQRPFATLHRSRLPTYFPYSLFSCHILFPHPADFGRHPRL